MARLVRYYNIHGKWQYLKLTRRKLSKGSFFSTKVQRDGRRKTQVITDLHHGVGLIITRAEAGDCAWNSQRDGLEVQHVLGHSWEQCQPISLQFYVYSCVLIGLCLF